MRLYYYTIRTAVPSLRPLSLTLLLLAAVTLRSLGAESITPTVSPGFFTYSTLITVTYDVTGTPLESLTAAYAWVWIPGANVNAKYNINPASSNAAVTNVNGPAGPKFTRKVVSGRVLFEISFVPSSFFTSSITGQDQLGILLKGNDWSNGQTADTLLDFWDGSFGVKLQSPASPFVFVDQGDVIAIAAETPTAANFSLLVDNVETATLSNATSFQYNYTVPTSSGSTEVVVRATSVSNPLDVEEASFAYLNSVASPAMPRPTGIVPGINYHPSDPTRATLCLWAPLKVSAYLSGDFNNWEVSSSYLMNRDGEYFWKELTGLTPGVEYGYQYLIDEALWVADPYADKILDPDDKYIPTATYVGLKPYPAGAVRSKSYENRVAVLQTNQTPYAWQVTNFVKPAKKDLIIYELLIRDFFGDGQRNYQNLIDTIGYFKRLGVNAIELMPIMEFNGNEGWGYNPTFMFAPDKYYGTKQKLKEFIDKCHAEGIAVILDIALNHQDVPNPYALMYFEFGADGGFGKPLNNPWFNRDAKHPYNVFFDMNHESTYTQAYVDTVTHYWLNEFKVDGYRFDLSKGFTQNQRCGGSQSNDACFAQRDDSRIAILKRMADQIWLHTPDAIVILEHFADNSEERELAEYRAGEGKGMLLWGNLNYAYNQNTMGYASGSDIGWISYKNRNWSVPHVVGYMESHDEERLMFKNNAFGAASGSYDVREPHVGLSRMMGAGLLFYIYPGPKMVWQFGELGYPESINRCPDGSISDNCRLAEKPTPWNSIDDEEQLLFDHTADLLRLRHTYDVFSFGEASIWGGSSLTKQLTLKNTPYVESPTSTDDMNAHIIVNFTLQADTLEASFPHTGTWYDYYNQTEINVTEIPFGIPLTAGQFKMYTDVPINNPRIVGVSEMPLEPVVVYPNPVGEVLGVKASVEVRELSLIDLKGRRVSPSRLSANTWNTAGLLPGFYIAEIRTDRSVYRYKVVRR